jgi:hypothetical protein
MEKISWADRVRNEEIVHKVKQERNILYTVKQRKANWICEILRRKYLPKHVSEGNIEEKNRKEGDVSSYWMTFRRNRHWKFK